MSSVPVLWLVIPCYNEEDVLPYTAPEFLKHLEKLADDKKISEESKILFVDDGSNDRTWKIITDLSERDSRYKGIRQSRNRGHQNALLAGLMEAIDKCDITISADCDGQDDLNVMGEMVDAYKDGCEIVYGVRSCRQTDTWFKRNSARAFYKLMNRMGANVVFDHADYRLVSNKVLKSFSCFTEVNVFLRGIFPLVGYKSTSVYYERRPRKAGKTHYSIKKMIEFSLDGIFNLSTKPLHIIVFLGATISLFGAIGVIWMIVANMSGKTMAGSASLAWVAFFMGGVQIFCTGIIGEYVGRTYLETKRRPRYIISERTGEELGDELPDSPDSSKYGKS